MRAAFFKVYHLCLVFPNELFNKHLNSVLHTNQS